MFRGTLLTWLRFSFGFPLKSRPQRAPKSRDTRVSGSWSPVLWPPSPGNLAASHPFSCFVFFSFFFFSSFFTGYSSGFHLTHSGLSDFFQPKVPCKPKEPQWHALARKSNFSPPQKPLHSPFWANVSLLQARPFWFPRGFSRGVALAGEGCIHLQRGPQRPGEARALAAGGLAPEGWDATFESSTRRKQKQGEAMPGAGEVFFLFIKNKVNTKIE